MSLQRAHSQSVVGPVIHPMHSTDVSPRFRKLSNNFSPSQNGTPRYVSSSMLFNDKDPEEHRDPEKECFMCRQANVYMKPIGMQQERRVAQRHPPPLTRAQLDELSQKKHLTKREVRKLLQCYFPEIKNVKYFQLHKYHSCCYDPKHLNLCKNHITALQREREQHLNHDFHKHESDEDHYKPYERNSGNQNRVSFVRIKIEPMKGIPTRFLGPTALPESLADMLIKQVNLFENKKKLPSFGTAATENPGQVFNLKRLEQPYGEGISRLSEHLANLDSDDDDDDDENDSDNDSDEDNHKSGIFGYHGKVIDKSRVKYEKRIQSNSEKDSRHINLTNGDLVVEDLDELKHLYVNTKESATMDHPQSSIKPLKKKKRKKGRKKKRTHVHHKPQLNHWEVLALDQAKQEVCGCRHHVKRLEADQVIYDWCRCKDHQHKDLKEKQKTIPPPPPTPPPRKPKQITPPPKVEKKTIGINATERTTIDFALAYDPTAIDYDVLQELIYYRTSSGRLLKPEITNTFTYDNMSSLKGVNHLQSLPKITEVLHITPREQSQPLDGDARKHQRINRLSLTRSISESSEGSIANGQSLVDNEPHVTTPVPDRIPSAYTKRQTYEDDNDEYGTAQFNPPKHIPEEDLMHTPIQSPIIPMSMQKSSKPTFKNQKPTPNMERQSSALADRRWFDQALGDQNLHAVKDGRYGLIAGTSTEQYLYNSQLPDNDYVERDVPQNKRNCTIS